MACAYQHVGAKSNAGEVPAYSAAALLCAVTFMHQKPRYAISAVMLVSMFVFVFVLVVTLFFLNVDDHKMWTPGCDSRSVATASSVMLEQPRR